MIYSKLFLSTAAILATIACTTAESNQGTKKSTSHQPSGITGTIKNTEEFCLWLPREPGLIIGQHEHDAVAFCTKSSMDGAPDARTLPEGFIQSVHLMRNTAADWIQLTGRIDRSKYSLQATDGGGQYDVVAPVGAKCSGYKYFVELLEPDAEIYCIRCCQDKVNCNRGKSTYGCKKVLGGDYS